MILYWLCTSRFGLDRVQRGISRDEETISMFSTEGKIRADFWNSYLCQLFASGRIYLNAIL